jgi:predicted DNA-binding transcriptional regulator AlpA
VIGTRSDLPEGDDGFITVEDFARIACVSRRTIDRYRRSRASGFPTEYDMSRGKVPRPRFKRADVLAWMETRALW